MRRTKLLWACCMASLLTLILLPRLAKAGQAEDPRVAEAQQAAVEEKELQTQGKVPDRGYESSLRGTFISIKPVGNQRDDIVGQFQVTGYAYAFHVKVMDPTGVDAEVISKLASFNGQSVMLGGKIRNKNATYPQGQYFIVGEVLSQSGGTFVPSKSNTAPGRL